MAMDVRSGGRRLGGLLLLVVVIGLLGSCGLRTISTGHVGVTTLFGRVTGERLDEGIHLVNPLKRVAELSVRTQEVKEQAAVPSSEGLIMRLEASLLYRLDPARAPDVFQRLGDGYSQVVISPNFRSVMRAVTTAHTASTLYSEGRETVARQMLEQMQKALGDRGIIVENVLLRDIVLPETLRNAIEAKQQADQEAQRMNFVLQRERQEAERKRIEAQGVADYQRIVAQGLNQQLLEWKGIEATMEIAKSQNSKVIVIGAPDERLAYARRMGASHTIGLDGHNHEGSKARRREDDRGAATERIDEVRRLNGGHGADVAIEASGAPEAVSHALDMVRDGGRVVVCGHYTDNGAVEIHPHFQINRKHLEIRGVWGCDYSHFHRAVTIAARHGDRIPWREMVSRTYSLDQAGEALAAVERREVLKALIAPNGLP